MKKSCLPEGNKPNILPGPKQVDMHKSMQAIKKETNSRKNEGTNEKKKEGKNERNK